jgi:hypothetical protein
MTNVNLQKMLAIMLSSLYYTLNKSQMNVSRHQVQKESYLAEVSSMKRLMKLSAKLLKYYKQNHRLTEAITAWVMQMLKII